MKLYEYNTEKGFTLIELIVAMFIFGVLATGMTTLMGVLIQNNEFSQDITEATTLAENKMEVFKNLDYASIPPSKNRNHLMDFQSSHWIFVCDLAIRVPYITI